MDNPYQPPQAHVADLAMPGENNSGQGASSAPPPGVKGWSWGAFFLNSVWAIGNKTWIGLLALVPYVGFLMAIYLGIKGREKAWQNKRWESIDHFNRVQRAWSKWAWIILIVNLIIRVMAGFLVGR